MNKEQLRAMGAHVIDLSEPLEKDNADEITVEEWEAIGKRLYGEDKMKWAFKCPNCGHKQTVEDFRPFKDKGAQPDTALFSCIGRWMPSEGTLGNKKQPCNYTLGGLFKLSSRVVVTPDGKRFGAFMFADEETT